MKKVQKASVSYALEALKKHIETIEENYLLTEEEVAQMKEIDKFNVLVIWVEEDIHLHSLLWWGSCTTFTVYVCMFCDMLE